MKKIFGLLIIVSLAIFGQQLTDLETQHRSLLERVAGNEQKLQALQEQLENQAREIDAMKNQSVAGESEIAAQMSSGIELTRAISELKAELGKDREDLASLQLELVDAYATAIDSLETELASARSDDRQGELQKELQAYTEKYLFVSPAVSLLKVDPGKIRTLETGVADDSLAALFYRGYLQSALDDIDTQLAIIDEQHAELEASVQLARNARDFMEEIDGQLLSPIFPATAENAVVEELVDNRGTDPTTGGDFVATLSSVDKYRALHALLRQLDSFGNNSILEVAAESEDLNITPENYLSLAQRGAQSALSFIAIASSGKLSDE